MRFSLAAAAALLASVVSSVFAADHTIIVGGNATLTFNPSSIQAAAGDSVIFQFQSKNHSVTQTTFANPCAGMANAVDSGFQATANGTTTFAEWKITINNASAPLWFYCAQTVPANHCQKGMVFAINANADKSFDAYLKNAQSFTGAAPASGSTTAAGGASTTAAGGASTTAAGATTSGSANTVGNTASPSASVSTSIGTIPVGSVPTPNAGLQGAAVSGTSEAQNAAATQPGSAMRLGGSLSAVLISVFISTLIL